MLKQIPKMLLLVALLVTFAVSSAPAFGAFTTVRNKGCSCICDGACKTGGGCQFDNTTGQCINFHCGGFCIGPI
jgi:hypothetical protein